MPQWQQQPIESYYRIYSCNRVENELHSNECRRCQGMSSRCNDAITQNCSQLSCSRQLTSPFDARRLTHIARDFPIFLQQFSVGAQFDSRSIAYAYKSHCLIYRSFYFYCFYVFQVLTIRWHCHGRHQMRRLVLNIIIMIIRKQTHLYVIYRKTHSNISQNRLLRRLNSLFYFLVNDCLASNREQIRRAHYVQLTQQSKHTDTLHSHPYYSL